MSVYIDLTEFLNTPVLTGIQRVTAEICRHWPNGGLRPVKLGEAGDLVELPTSLIGAVARCFKDQTGAAVREVLSLRDKVLRSMRGNGFEILLVPELFYEPRRVEFYRRMDDATRQRCRFIVYDLMPLIHPEYFSPDMAHDVICGYFSMIRCMPHCGFISEWTRSAYRGRLLRSNDISGVVLRLGSDGLGPRPRGVGGGRGMEFCAVGTIEPRKNHSLILEAFEPLLHTIQGLRLTFLGRLGWVDPKFAEHLTSFAAENREAFSWISDADDDCIRRHVNSARATVYVSSAEGFGLPPVESLWLGTPVIASSGLPSLETIGQQGVEIVAPLDVAQLRVAVQKFIENSFAAEKEAEALKLDLPTWASFARQVASWCEVTGNSSHLA